MTPGHFAGDDRGMGAVGHSAQGKPVTLLLWWAGQSMQEAGKFPASTLGTAGPQAQSLGPAPRSVLVLVWPSQTSYGLPPSSGATPCGFQAWEVH